MRLCKRIRKSKTFNQGFITVEYLASALYDMKIHLAATPDKTIDPDEFEQMTMAELGCPKEIVMRHRPTHLATSSRMTIIPRAITSISGRILCRLMPPKPSRKLAGFYDRKTCDRFRDSIFIVGNSVPPEVAFRNFRGRDVDTNALMRDRGFPVS